MGWRGGEAAASGSSPRDLDTLRQTKTRWSPMRRPALLSNAFVDGRGLQGGPPSHPFVRLLAASRDSPRVRCLRRAVSGFTHRKARLAVNTWRVHLPRETWLRNRANAWVHARRIIGEVGAAASGGRRWRGWAAICRATRLVPLRQWRVVGVCSAARSAINSWVHAVAIRRAAIRLRVACTLGSPQGLQHVGVACGGHGQGKALLALGGGRVERGANCARAGCRGLELQPRGCAANSRCVVCSRQTYDAFVSWQEHSEQRGGRLRSMRHALGGLRHTVLHRAMNAWKEQPGGAFAWTRRTSKGCLCAASPARAPGGGSVEGCCARRSPPDGHLETLCGTFRHGGLRKGLNAWVHATAAGRAARRRMKMAIGEWGGGKRRAALATWVDRVHEARMMRRAASGALRSAERRALMAWADAAVPMARRRRVLCGAFTSLASGARRKALNSWRSAARSASDTQRRMRCAVGEWRGTKPARMLGADGRVCGRRWKDASGGHGALRASGLRRACNAWTSHAALRRGMKLAARALRHTLTVGHAPCRARNVKYKM